MMEVRPYFEKIEDVIIEDIRASKQQLLIAVAWFTNHKIFDAIIEKFDGDGDFTAKLIVINDDINHRPGGLDFQRFVSAGGCLYFAEKNIPMHNKYMVIDSDVVITGSYNYTYYAETLNDENIVRIEANDSIVKSYVDNFKSLVEKKPRVTNVKEYLSVNQPAKDLFSYNNYALKDMSLQSDYTGVAGVTVETQNPIQKVEEVEYDGGYENFVINNVVYEQWKDYYYIDRIEVRANIIKILFKTNISDGCWLCSPETPCSWIIRSSSDKDVFAKCYAVRDVFVNSELVINEARPGTLYYFYKEDIPKSFHNNSCGYEEDKNYQPIDSNGNLVPIHYIKIPAKGQLTCEVCFMANPKLTNGTLDFLEGVSGEKKKEHWNAFKIQMNLNRERSV